MVGARGVSMSGVMVSCAWMSIPALPCPLKAPGVGARGVFVVEDPLGCVPSLNDAISAPAQQLKICQSTVDVSVPLELVVTNEPEPAPVVREAEGAFKVPTVPPLVFSVRLIVAPASSQTLEIVIVPAVIAAEVPRCWRGKSVTEVVSTVATPVLVVFHWLFAHVVPSLISTTVPGGSDAPASQSPARVSGAVVPATVLTK